MHRFGVYALVVGALLTITGLVLGFGFLIVARDSLTKPFLGMVPLGFLVGFLGIVMTLLAEPGSND